MERYYDVIKRSLELSETLEEGLIYVEEKLGEGQIEDTIDLIGDIIQGFITIQESIKLMETEFNLVQLNSLIETINKDFDLLADTYEKNDIYRVNYVLPLLLNDYRIWKIELHRLLDKYVGS